MRMLTYNIVFRKLVPLFHRKKLSQENKKKSHRTSLLLITQLLGTGAKEQGVSSTKRCNEILWLV